MVMHRKLSFGPISLKAIFQAETFYKYFHCENLKKYLLKYLKSDILFCPFSEHHEKTTKFQFSLRL